MKITGKGRLCIPLCILGVSVAALLAAGLWFFSQLSAQNAPLDIARPTEPDTVEAKRKLAIIEQPTQRQGYIDFSEGELNSLIHELYFAKTKRKTQAPATNAWHLNKLRIKLSEDSITCYSWASRTLLWKEWDFCWARTVTLGYSSNQWQIALQSVRVGNRELPFKRWSWAFGTVGLADQPMAERLQWFRGLPWAELHVDKDKPIPMLRLYNYIPNPQAPVKP
jgi:hypothetical protein